MVYRGWVSGSGSGRAILRWASLAIRTLWLPCGWEWRCGGICPNCSCLENPRDGGAWWAAVYGVAQSQTWLKWLSSSSSSSTGETVGAFLQSFSVTSPWKGSALSLILSHSGASHSSPGSSVSPGKTVFEAWGSAWEYNLSRREGRILLASVLTPKSIQRPGWQCACVCWISCFILLLDLHKGTWVGTLPPRGLVSFFMFFSCL